MGVVPKLDEVPVEIPSRSDSETLLGAPTGCMETGHQALPSDESSGLLTVLVRCAEVSQLRASAPALFCRKKRGW